MGSLDHLSVTDGALPQQRRQKEVSPARWEALKNPPGYFGKDVARVWKLSGCFRVERNSIKKAATRHCTRRYEVQRGV